MDVSLMYETNSGAESAAEPYTNAQEDGYGGAQLTGLKARCWHPVKQGGLGRALSCKKRTNHHPLRASERGALTVLLPLCSPEYDSNFAIGLNLFLGTVGVNVNLITASSLDGSRIVPSTRGLPLRLVCWCYMSTHYRCGCSF